MKPDNGKKPPSAVEFLTDQPIQDSSQDRFGRAAFAKSLAQAIRAMSGSEPFVFGLSGSWGSGKTSLLNLVEKEILAAGNDIVVFRFNPWWFSGSNAIFTSFLHDFCAAIGSKIQGKLGKSVSRKLELLTKIIEPARYVPKIGFIPGAFAFFLSKVNGVIRRRSENALQNSMEIRRSLDVQLLQRRLPVVVILDDVDRLMPDEVVDFIRIVKTLADFPYVRYIMAYDEEKIAGAIETSIGINGHEFLEKIVQLPLTIPPISRAHLDGMFFEGIDRIIGDVPDHLHNDVALGNIYHGGISQLISSPRLLIRLLNTIQMAYSLVRGEVYVVDFIAIQVLMVFEPKIHKEIQVNSHLFINSLRPEDPVTMDFLKRLEQSCSTGTWSAISKLLRRIFPRFGATLGGAGMGPGFDAIWSSHAQVASNRHFAKYFRLSLEINEISQSDIATLLGRINNPDAIDQWLKNWILSSEGRPLSQRVSEVIRSLTDMAASGSQLDGKQCKELIGSFLRVGDIYMEVDDYGVEDWPAETRVLWLLRYLIEGIKSPEERIGCLRNSFDQATAFHTMLCISQSLGNDYGMYGAQEVRPDQALLLEESCKELANFALQKVINLAGERKLMTDDPLGVAWLWKTMSSTQDAISWLRSYCEDETVFLSIIRRYTNQKRSWGWGDSVARLSSSLDVGHLCIYFEPLSLRSRARGILDDQMRLENLDIRTKTGLQRISKMILDDGTIKQEM